MSRSLVFPYPTVQYIPISFMGFEQFESGSAPPFILVTRDVGSLQSHWERFNSNLLILPELAENEAYILVIGMMIHEIKYRGYYSTILGTNTSRGFIGKIPTQYFYKDPIIFQVKDAKGRMLAQCQYSLKA